MDGDDLLFQPGVVAANYEGDLPQDSGIQNLQTNFSPSLTNLLPDVAPSSPSLSSLPNLPTSMDDFLGLSGSSDDLLTPAQGTSLLNFGEGLGTSLVGAFVTNPQNAATAEGVALQKAEISAAQTSQIFSYLIFGVIIFAVISLFGGGHK